MAFQLTLGFVGECLFVPVQETSSTPAAMHVLMPSVPPLVAPEPFVASLAFDRAYAQPGSPRTTGEFTTLLMERVSLALGTASGPLDLALPDDVAAVGAVARSPIRPGAFGNDPPAFLTARVDLFSGAATVTGPGGDWFYPAYPDCTKLTNALNWTLQMDGEQLDLELASFSGTTLARHTLFPIDGALVVGVYCTPASNLPPHVPIGQPPAVGTPLPTFGAYYQAFESPAAEPLPTFCGFAQAAGPYTCMLAWSPPCPAGDVPRETR